MLEFNRLRPDKMLPPELFEGHRCRMSEYGPWVTLRMSPADRRKTKRYLTRRNRHRLRDETRDVSGE